jgi:hypothetical protein
MVDCVFFVMLTFQATGWGLGVPQPVTNVARAISIVKVSIREFLCVRFIGFETVHSTFSG